MKYDRLEMLVKQTIEQEHMLPAGAGVVVGVSGGPDSMALLFALCSLAPALGLKLLVAHVNHGLRGEESDADEQFVKEAASKLGLAFVSRKIELAPGGNLEDRARELRYQFLLDAARDAAADYIAVGHHADDISETVLINLVRGAGALGLSGIAPMREVSVSGGIKYIVRPLFRVGRDEIEAYLGRKGQEFRRDSSNRDPRFIRNRMRAELIPLLESMNPEVRKALLRTAEISRRDSELIQSLARDWLMEYAEAAAGSIGFGLVPLCEALPALRMAVYREAVLTARGSLHGIALSHLEAIDSLVTSGPAHGSLDLPGLAIRREYKKLSMVRAGAEHDLLPAVPDLEPVRGQAREIDLPVPGAVIWKGPAGAVFTIRAELSRRAKKDPDPASQVWLDPPSVFGAMRVRTRRPGDRYRPAGMRGSRKLKDVMNQMKIPPRLRDLWPLVADAKDILWVPGFRVADKAKPTSSQVIKIIIRPPVLPIK